MVILGLDLSTHTGYALIKHNQLIEYGILNVPRPTQSIPFESYIDVLHAKMIASQVIQIVKKTKPDYIYIEQTNIGKSRGTQKLLEFIHCMVLQTIAAQYKNTKNTNYVVYIDSSRWRQLLQIKLNKEQRKHNMAVKQKLKRGRLTAKHLTVYWANKTYNLSLKLKDNDIADAIALATCGYILESKNKSLPDVISALE